MIHSLLVLTCWVMLGANGLSDAAINNPVASSAPAAQVTEPLPALRSATVPVRVQLLSKTVEGGYTRFRFAVQVEGEGEGVYSYAWSSFFSASLVSPNNQRTATFLVRTGKVGRGQVRVYDLEAGVDVVKWIQMDAYVKPVETQY